jgi:phospholipid-translocating ATPase
LVENNNEGGFFNWWRRVVMRRIPLSSRSIDLGKPPSNYFPPNVVSNQKYSLISFIPVILYEQFRFFFNLYFLVVALSQLIPVLQVGKYKTMKDY